MNAFISHKDEFDSVGGDDLAAKERPGRSTRPSNFIGPPGCTVPPIEETMEGAIAANRLLDDVARGSVSSDDAGSWTVDLRAHGFFALAALTAHGVALAQASTCRYGDVRWDRRSPRSRRSHLRLRAVEGAWPLL